MPRLCAKPPERRQPQNEADRECVLKAASACVAWESSASRLKRDESSQSLPNQKYASVARRQALLGNLPPRGA
jgi:hypothetical protein